MSFGTMQKQNNYKLLIDNLVFTY